MKNASSDHPVPRDEGMLFPSQRNILEAEVATAARVAGYAFDQGAATIERPTDDLRAWIEGVLDTPDHAPATQA